MKIVGIVVLIFSVLLADMAMAAPQDKATLDRLNSMLRISDDDKKYFKNWDKIDEIRQERQIHYTKIPEILKKEDALILDVRSKEDYDCGHIKGAKNLSLTDITEKTLPQIVPSKQTKIIIYCEKTLWANRRNIPATQISFPIIYELGYENVYEIEPVMDGRMLKDFKDILSFEKSEQCNKDN